MPSRDVLRRLYHSVAPTYSISGYARDADGSTPVPGALVTLGAYSALSGADGAYTITGIPPGTNGSMTCTKTGYSWTAKTIVAMSGNLAAQNFTNNLWNGGALKAWFDFSDISTLFQDAAGTTPVTADAQSIRNVTDKSGNSNKLTNAGAVGTVPVYKTGIQNSLGAVFGDGGDNLQSAAFGAEMAQPNTIICAFKNPVLVVNEFIYDGISATKRHACWVASLTDSSEGWSFYAGATMPTMDVSSLMLITSTVFNTTSSRIRFNGAQVGGTRSAGTHALTGITLLADTTLGNRLNGYILEYLLYAGDITDAKIAYTESYINTKWAVY